LSANEQLTDRCYDYSSNRNAIKDGNAALVAEIVQADPSLASFVDGQRQSMLHLATIFNAHDIVVQLLAAGADPTVLNKQNESVFAVAPPAIANLLSKGNADNGLR
jgi:ankyrin repeat protein